MKTDTIDEPYCNTEPDDLGELFGTPDSVIEPTRRRDRAYFERKATEALIHEQQQRWWQKIPEEFKQPIDRSRESVDWAAFDEIQSWDGCRSIFAKGRSQLGKTRAIYAAIMRNGENFTVLDDWKFACKISDAASRGKLEELIEQWAAASVLFLDDIDKINFVNGVTGTNNCAVFFGLVKKRMAEHLPTIISANLDIADMLAGVPVHVIKSLEERMNQPDHWMKVEFKQQH